MGLQHKKRWLIIGAFCIICCGLIALAYIQRDSIRESYELWQLPHYSESTTTPDECPQYIAHGGGIAKGLKRTNSKDALDETYARGYRFFELDFSWTSDQQLVALHDWDETVVNLFGGTPGAISLEQFRQLKMRHGLQQMTLNDVLQWLAEHPDAHIITDVKGDNLAALQLIANAQPELKNRIIPQVYRFPQITAVRDFGYTQVILTLYLSRYSDKAILDFAKQQKPFAITMPIDRAITALPRLLAAANTMTYVHGAIDESLKQKLDENGIAGIYTSKLLPPLAPQID